MTFNDTEFLIIQAMAMRLSEKDALEWLASHGKPLKRAQYYRIKERTAYKVIGYPYLEGVGGFTKDSDNRKIAAWGVPEGSIRFWKRSAKELRELRNKFFASEIKRIDLWRIALRRIYYRKYKYDSNS